MLCIEMQNGKALMKNETCINCINNVIYELAMNWK